MWHYNLQNCILKQFRYKKLNPFIGISTQDNANNTALEQLHNDNH